MISIGDLEVRGQCSITPQQEQGSPIFKAPIRTTNSGLIAARLVGGENGLPVVWHVDVYLDVGVSGQTLQFLENRPFRATWTNPTIQKPAETPWQYE